MSAFGTIGTWLLGQAVKPITSRILNELFKEDLSRRLAQVSESWVYKLPDGERLATIEAIFPKADRLDNPPPPPTNVLTKLEKCELPSANDWFEDLLHQWNWVRVTVEEPQAFFQVSKDRARSHLLELANALELECQKDRELFQVKCIELLKQHTVALEEVSKKLDQKNAFDAQFGTKLDSVLQKLDSIPSQQPSNVGGFHSEIDAAVAFTRQGQPDIAIAQLESLRRRNWEQLDDREKYRVVANIAFGFDAKGQHQEAARQFIECKTYQPLDEKARSLEAMGHFMLGNSQRAFELATEICSDFPNSDLGHDTWVRSAPDEMSFETLESRIPEHVRGYVETASALSFRAMWSGNLAKAEEYGRKALSHDVSCPRLMEHLGLVLLESERRNAATQYSESPAISNPEKLQEAEALFLNVLEKIPPHLVANRGRARCHLGMIQRLLGKKEEVYENIQAAFESNKQNPLFVAQYTAELCDAGQQDRAIVILRNAQDADESGQVLILLAHLLATRNTADDLAEAIKLLSQRIGQPQGLEPSTRSEIVETLVDLYCRADRCSEAAAMLQSQRGLLMELSYHAINSRYLRRIGNTEAAKGEAREAQRLCAPEIDRREMRRIALELSILGLHQEGFPIWKQLVEPRYFGIDTEKLLYTAEKCGDAKFQTEFCAKLRQNGVFERDLFHCEINKLREYNCLTRAIHVMHEFLQTAPEGQLAKEIRARLSHLAIIVRREEFAEFNPQRLPAVTDVETDLGLVIVEVLSHGPVPLDGVRFAYELLRRDFGSHVAHKAMVMSFLAGRGPALKLPEFPLAGPGSAVLYKDHYTERDHWHIIEDSPDPDPARNEYPPDHPISAAMTDLGVGAEFFLQRDNIQERKATIVDVWSKYKLRFNLCMEEWTNRFPEKRFLWQFRVKKNAKDKSDFEEIFRTIDQRVAETQKRDELYRVNPFSVTNYAVMMGCSVLEAAQHIGSQKDLPIRCCSGAENEYQAADEALESGAGIILDGSTLATMFLTQTHKQLRNLKHDFFVSEGTLQEWRQRFLEKLNSPKEGAFLAKDGDKYVFIEEGPEAVELRLGKFREFIETIETVARLEEGMALCEFPQEVRETLVATIGRPAAETIAIARSKHLVMWSDDLVVATFGRHEGHVRRIWTDAVFRWARQRDLVTADDRNRLVVELVRLGYFYTRLEPDVVVAAAKQSNWDITNASLAPLIDWFSNPFTLPGGILWLALEILPEISRLSRNENPLRSEMLVTQLLSEIGKRPDGRKIITQLHKALAGRNHTDVLTDEDVIGSIEVWKMAQRPLG